jgi:predicted lipid-binding transport protein (Tim44 family)
MNSPLLQLLVLAGIAVFLFIRLKNVLGTRDGFEKPPEAELPAPTSVRRDFEVIEGGPDRDITDHVPEDSPSATALAEMKRVDSSFEVSEFLSGARGAYEMILMAFERGELEDIRSFLSSEVFETFETVVAASTEQGLPIEAAFIGVQKISINEAPFDKISGVAELTIRIIGELTNVVRNAQGDLVEGNETSPKQQKDIWTFARVMGTDDPNWQLIATGE